VNSMNYEPWNRPLGTYSLYKYNRRLYIAYGTSLVYTIPDFLTINSRQQLQELVDRANLRGQLVIADVIIFESRLKRPRSYSQRTSILEWEPL
jgi:hypothetical protein